MLWKFLDNATAGLTNPTLHNIHRQIRKLPGSSSSYSREGPSCQIWKIPSASSGCWNIQCVNSLTLTNSLLDRSKYFFVCHFIIETWRRFRWEQPKLHHPLRKQCSRPLQPNSMIIPTSVGFNIADYVTYTALRFNTRQKNKEALD